MLNLNKCTKNKSKPKPTLSFKNCSHIVCAYHCTQLLYTTQCRTVLITFPLIIQTIIIAQTMSTGGRGKQKLKVARCGNTSMNTVASAVAFVTSTSCVLQCFNLLDISSTQGSTSTM